LRVERNRRTFTARELMHFRGMDRGYYAPLKRPFIRGLTDTRNISKYNLRIFGKKGAIEKTVMRKIKEQNKPVKILDIGCGACRFLADLRKKYGNQIELDGITLARSFPTKRLVEIKDMVEKREQRKLGHDELKTVKRLERRRMVQSGRVKKYGLNIHIGPAETHRYGKKYDLIFSAETFMHAINPEQALKNTLEHLKKGGEAYIDFGVRDILNERPELITELKKKGILIEPLKRGSYHFKVL